MQTAVEEPAANGSERSSKLSKDNRPPSSEGGSLNLSMNSNEESFKDESQQMFKELF